MFRMLHKDHIEAYTWVKHTHILKWHFCPLQFYHWNVIQNEATVCCRTMRTPLSGRVGCLECIYIYYVPPTSKTKVAPLTRP